MSTKSVYIAWSLHARRAETLSAELELDEVSFQYEEKLKAPWMFPLRYFVQSWKTWHYLERQQPEVVLVQSPPIFAIMIVAVWCQLRGKTRSSGRRACYVLDCHPATWYNPRWRWARPLIHLLSLRAAATLCTNEGAQDILRRWKVKGFFLSDGIPTLSPPMGNIGSEGEARVGIIGSLDPDEPLTEVFNAAKLLPNVTFYITGDPRRLSTKLLARKPKNIILTGFLRGGAYTSLLYNMHGLVVLTNVTNALNCAAYEAVAAKKPTVVSDWLEMRHCFSRGFIYVNNTAEEIAAGIKKLLDEQAMLIPEVIALHSELAARRQPKLQELVALLN